MKKRSYIYLLLFISIILFVILSTFLFNYKKQSASFFSLCITENEFIELKKNKKESKELLLKEIEFDGNILFLDERDKRFYYSLVENSTTAYNPTVEWNGTRYNISIKDNKITEELIHNNEDIDIVIYNDKEYSLAKITCTTLPLMNVNVDVALEEIDETYQDARMILFDNKNNITTDLNGEIHVRGSRIAKYPKKSYKLKLKEDKDNNDDTIRLLDLRESREYILYPGYNDEERIRNVFSTNLWYESCAQNNIYGLNSGQYYIYYEMFINNKYNGLYAIACPIDENVLNLDMDKKSKGYLVENLYKKIDGAKNEYLVDWNNAPVEGYSLKTNEDNPKAWESLKKYYTYIFNKKTVDEIYENIDINNAIDIFLFYNLVQGIDNVSCWDLQEHYLHNTYMYSKVYKDGYKMLYIPWDLDRTWGKYDDGDYYYLDYTYNSIMYINPIFNLIDLGENDIKLLIKKRYDELREYEWSNDKILNDINYYEEEIYGSGSYLRDIKKWPNSALNIPETELKVFKEYVINRLNYFDTYINEFVK